MLRLREHAPQLLLRGLQRTHWISRIERDAIVLLAELDRLYIPAMIAKMMRRLGPTPGYSKH